MAHKSLPETELFAYVGEDEFGSGEIGIKRGLCPAGDIPLVSIHQHKLSRPEFIEQLQQQANHYGKTIRLCRYVFAEEVLAIEPQKGR
jgi:hypothetical protein